MTNSILSSHLQGLLDSSGYSNLTPSKRIKCIAHYFKDQALSFAESEQNLLLVLCSKEIDQIFKGHQLIKACHRIAKITENHPQLSLPQKWKEKTTFFTLEFQDRTGHFPRFMVDALALESDFFKAYLNNKMLESSGEIPLKLPTTRQKFSLLTAALLNNQPPESPQQALDILQAGLPFAVSPFLAEELFIETINQGLLDDETFAANLAIANEFDQSPSRKIKEALAQYFFDALLENSNGIQETCREVIQRLCPQSLLFSTWEKLPLLIVLSEKLPNIRWKMELNTQESPHANLKNLLNRSLSIESFHIIGDGDLISKEQLTLIAQSPLIGFSAEGVQLDDSILEVLLKNPSLKSLTLKHQVNVTSQGLKNLSTSRLAFLTIHGCQHLTSKFYEEISQNPSLFIDFIP